MQSSTEKLLSHSPLGEMVTFLKRVLAEMRYDKKLGVRSRGPDPALAFTHRITRGWGHSSSSRSQIFHCIKYRNSHVTVNNT